MNTSEIVKGRGRGRGRGVRGRKGRGRGRGRGGRKVVSRPVRSDDEVPVGQEEDQSEKYNEDSTSAITLDELTNDESNDNDIETTIISDDNESAVPTTSIDMEADISQLEAPTFTTITRNPPEPMLRLNWDHKVNLVGEKVLNPMIHCCDICDNPILVYGRMIPCKHVFCLKCAKAEPVKNCPRCKEKVLRVEQSGLGTVFMCTHGGSTYGNTGCRRTYLSQRDLQAHINHRHVPPSMSTTVEQSNEKSLPSAEGKPPRQQKVSECSSPVSAIISTTTQPKVARTNYGSTTQESSNPLPKPSIQVIPTALLQAPIYQQQLSTQTESIADSSYYSSALSSYSSPTTLSQIVPNPQHAINPNYGQVAAHQPPMANPSTSVASANQAQQLHQQPVGNQGASGFCPYDNQVGQGIPPNLPTFDPKNLPKNINNPRQFYR